MFRPLNWFFMIVLGLCSVSYSLQIHGSQTHYYSEDASSPTSGFYPAREALIRHMKTLGGMARVPVTDSEYIFYNSEAIYYGSTTDYSKVYYREVAAVNRPKVAAVYKWNTDFLVLLSCDLGTIVTIGFTNVERLATATLKLVPAHVSSVVCLEKSQVLFVLQREDRFNFLLGEFDENGVFQKLLAESPTSKSGSLISDFKLGSWAIDYNLSSKVAIAKNAEGATFSTVIPGTQHVIMTHDGMFHCDEVLALVMLLVMLEFKDAYVYRTRDKEMLELGTIVVDVGGVFDLDTLRFDHHQRDFNETFSKKFWTKMSSSGLVFKYYHVPLIKQLYAEKRVAFQRTLRSNVVFPEVLSAQQIKSIAFSWYKLYLEELDAVDNGIDTLPQQTICVEQSKITNHIYRLNQNLGPARGHGPNRFAVALKEMKKFMYLSFESTLVRHFEIVPLAAIAAAASRGIVKRPVNLANAPCYIDDKEEILLLPAYIPFERYIHEFPVFNKVKMILHPLNSPKTLFRLYCKPIKYGSPATLATLNKTSRPESVKITWDTRLKWAQSDNLLALANVALAAV